MQNDWQLERTGRKVRIIENLGTETLSAQVIQQYHTVLKSCAEVHLGPKIEYHTHLQSASCSVNDKTSNDEVFLKYKEILKNSYITNYAYMRSFLWEGMKKDFPIKNYFVQLTVEKSEWCGKKMGEKIKLQEMFSKEYRGYQTILVSGGPGYGKTTLCKKLAFDWANDEISSTYLDHFNLVVVIALRELGENSVYDSVLHKVFQNNKDEFKTIIEKLNLNLLVILDGFDEAVNKRAVLEFVEKEAFDMSLRMTVLVTRRPEATENVRQFMKLRFSVEGFSEEQQQKYIRLVFKDDEPYKINELCQILNCSEFYQELAKCPLMLHMLCCLHKKTVVDSRIKDMTTLYIIIFRLITERYIRKNGSNHNLKKGKCFIGEDILKRLGELADCVYPINSKILQQRFNENEVKFIVGLDIIELYSFSDHNNDVYYEFVHLSFKEFLSAFARFYNNFTTLQSISSMNTMAFLLGLFGRKSFPIHFVEYLKKEIFIPRFMIQAYKEIKLERLWLLFCSISHVKFDCYSLDDLRLLLNIYPDFKLYFWFPQNREIYENYRDQLIDLNKNFNLSVSAEIKMFPIVKTDLPKTVYDLREVASFIIDFFHEIGSLKHQISFCGINDIVSYSVFVDKVRINSKEMSKEMRDYLCTDENEEFVALKTKQYLNNINTFFISAKQYEILKDYIQLSPIPVWNISFSPIQPPAVTNQATYGGF